MSGYAGQDNYWTQPPQGQSSQTQYFFESPGFEQPNQQFEFQPYGDYSNAQKSFLDPTQSSYSGDMFVQDDYAKG